MDVEEVGERGREAEHLDAVRTRLTDLESRAATVQERADALGPAFQDLLDRDPETADLYDLAAAVASLTDEANDVQRAADQHRVLGLPADVSHLPTYLYQSLPVTYPVLAAFAELARDLRAVERRLDAIRAVTPA